MSSASAGAGTSRPNPEPEVTWLVLQWDSVVAECATLDQALDVAKDCYRADVYKCIDYDRTPRRPTKQDIERMRRYFERFDRTEGSNDG